MRASDATIWVDVRLVDEATPNLRALRHRLWEWQWAELTGRPWGWVAPAMDGSVDITLDGRWPQLSKVMVGDLPLPVMSVQTTTRMSDVPTVLLEVPMWAVALSTRP